MGGPPSPGPHGACLSPPCTRRLEFIGDSDFAAFGNEAGRSASYAFWHIDGRYNLESIEFGRPGALDKALVLHFSGKDGFTEPPTWLDAEPGGGGLGDVGSDGVRFRSGAAWLGRRNLGPAALHNASALYVERTCYRRHALTSPPVAAADTKTA